MSIQFYGGKKKAQMKDVYNYSDNITEIDGIITKEIFYNDTSNFGIYTISVIENGKKTKFNYCVKGKTAQKLIYDTQVKFFGKIVFNKDYGKQFDFNKYEIVSESQKTEKGLVCYLSSGMIEGIGKVTAQKIVDLLGLDAIEKIINDYTLLTQIRGISDAKALKIKKSLQESDNLNEFIIYCNEKEIDITTAIKIYKKFGSDSFKILNSNPYIIMNISRIGFDTADKIALKLGFEVNNPIRIKSAIVFILNNARYDGGHVCLPGGLFYKKCCDLLKSNSLINDIKKCEEILIKDNIIFVKEYNGEFYFYSSLLYRAENGVSLNVTRLLEYKHMEDYGDLYFKVVKMKEVLTIDPSQEQENALLTVLQNKVSIITGGPGTGKTTIIRALMSLDNVALCAPTGKAAKRMFESTGFEAKTIHRFLEYRRGDEDNNDEEIEDVENKNDKKDAAINGYFYYNRNNQVDFNMVIVDESSMMDTFIFYHLLEALPSHCRLVLVGDIDQLPSVDAGNILRELIQSGKVPCIYLTEIFRQAQESNIIKNAYRINNSKMPDLNMYNDWCFSEQQIREGLYQSVESIIEMISAKNGYQDILSQIMNIQILTPMKVGDFGTEQLNLHLQNYFNKNGKPIKYTRFRIGDKVMQIKNNYKKEIFNGEVGIINNYIEADDLKYMVIDFGDRLVEYDVSDSSELIFAYASTIHKYQGSEIDNIIIVLHNAHYIMLKKNLLYTAVTRGKKFVGIVGCSDAIKRSIKNNDAEKRYTLLSNMIKEM